MKEILDEKAIDRVLTRISHEITENNKGVEDLVIVGIKTRGEFIAKRIIEKIHQFEGVYLPFTSIDITFYRDDLIPVDRSPQINSTIDWIVEDKIVILVDDVMYTGRTCRAALEAVFKAGRAKKIQFVALIDRGHRELPIVPNYVGKNLPTAKDEEVIVKVKEVDSEDCVLLKKLNKHSL